MRRLGAYLLLCGLLASFAGVMPASASAVCTITVDASDETIEGTDGDDVICIIGNNNVVNASFGNDTVVDSGENNIIYLGAGDDTYDGLDAFDGTVYGLDGNDVIVGTPGDDVIDAGTGDDTVTGQSGDDAIIGGAGNDNLGGGLGTDNLAGSSGDDTISGDDGADTLNGDDGIDTLNGGTGDDQVRGGAGADYLNGAEGDDSLVGGDGIDRFTDSLGQNFCDKTTGERVFAGCQFDLAAPVLVSVSEISGTFDSSDQDNQLDVTLTVTDDLSGLNRIGIFCDGEQSVPLRAELQRNSSGWASYSDGRWASYSPTGNSKNLTATIGLVIKRGASPKTYQCSLVLTDAVNNSTSVQNAGNITITRTGTFDEEGPTSSNFALSSLRVDNALSLTQVVASIDVSDPSGIKWVSVGCRNSDFFVLGTSANLGNGGWLGSRFAGNNYSVRNIDVASSVTGTAQNLSFALVIDVPTNVPLTAYNCELRADDYLGNQTIIQTGIALTVDKSGRPSAPQNVAVENVLARSAQLTWTAPDDDGTSSITGFEIQRCNYAGTECRWIGAAPASATSATVLVRPNDALVLRVAAINSVGTGEFGYTETFGTPFGVPDEPTELAASVTSSSSLVLVCTAPTSDGGPGISDYKIEISSNAGKNWTVVDHDVSSRCEFTLTDLSPGATYLIRASAVNSEGASAPSSSLSVTMPAGAAGAPTSLKASSLTANSVTLSWTPPFHNGGSPIINYRVEISRDGSNWTQFNSATNILKVSGMMPTTSYQVRVSAQNSSGYSAFLIGSVLTLSGPPSSPTNLSASSVTSSGVTLAWDIPDTNGGSSIVDYKIEYSINGTRFISVRDSVTPTRNVTVNGLAAGTKYWFRISAISSRGAGPASSTLEQITEGVVPSAPTSLSIAARAKKYVLSWRPPITAGFSTIRDYTVEYSIDSGATWMSVSKAASTSTSLTMTGLAKGVAHQFRVVAVTDLGSTSPSSIYNVTIR